MNFTDKDLQELKDWQKELGSDGPDWPVYRLIARLEAAEQVCFGVTLAHPENETCECSLCDLLRAWREVSGK